MSKDEAQFSKGAIEWIRVPSMRQGRLERNPSGEIRNLLLNMLKRL